MKFSKIGSCSLALLVLCAACGDDDEPSPDPAAPTAMATLGPQQEDQGRLDEAIGTYVAENFPQAPSYKGDCEAEPTATCSQFRGLDSTGLEYFLLGDPGSLESLAWLVLMRVDEEEWQVIDHDLSRGWSRGDTAVIVAGQCQEVRSEPGLTAVVVDCLEAATPVTVSGGPRYSGGLFFPIGEERWIPGTGLCSPQEDEGCAAES
jgi:hypothetical protein